MVGCAAAMTPLSSSSPSTHTSLGLLPLQSAQRLDQCQVAERRQRQAPILLHNLADAHAGDVAGDASRLELNRDACLSPRHRYEPGDVHADHRSASADIGHTAGNVDGHGLGENVVAKGRLELEPERCEKRVRIAP